MGKNQKSISFDECFSAFPSARSPADFSSFWRDALKKQKKISLNPSVTDQGKAGLSAKNAVVLAFRGHDGHELRAFFSLPSEKRSRYPLVVSFHDYQETPISAAPFLAKGIAHCSLELRGHDRRTWPVGERENKGAPPPPPAFLQVYGLKSLEMSYIYLSFIDAIRCLELVRNRRDIHPSKIGIHGSGFGTLLALFAAHFSEGVSAIAFERGSPLWLDGFLIDSGVPLAKEMRDMLSESMGPRQREIRKNLEYLEMLPLAEELTIPVLMTVDMDDRIDHPRPAFAFFNHLRCEKAFEIFFGKKEPGEREREREKILNFFEEKFFGKK